MMKVSLIDAIKHYEDLHGEGTVLDQSSQSMIAQGACGNSMAEQNEGVRLPKKCNALVDRNGTAEPGSNTYEIHVDLYSYVSLFI